MPRTACLGENYAYCIGNIFFHLYTSHIDVWINGIRLQSLASLDRVTTFITYFWGIIEENQYRKLNDIRHFVFHILANHYLGDQFWGNLVFR